MSTEDNKNERPSAIAQMEEVLIDKEKIINQKLEELNSTKATLEEFKAKLMQKVNELKAEQEAFAQEKAEFEAHVTAENERIDAAWVEIHEYEEKLKISTDEVLAEKVKFEMLQKERLEQELKADIPYVAPIENLSELAAMVGIDMEMSIDTKELENVTENIVVEDTNANFEEENKTSKWFDDFKSVAEKMFTGPKNYVIEITEEHFCMQIGEKELRIFNKEPLPEAHIVVNRKNAKNDAKLQKRLPLLSRAIPDWTFEAEANHLICKMYFTNQTNTELVLTRCKECIEKIDEL